MRIHKKMPKKKCSRCQIERPLNQFHNKKEARDGKNWTCKECTAVRVMYHGKSERRVCLKCQKSFKSYNGHRLCDVCNRHNSNINEVYVTGNITYRRTGAVS